MSDLPDMVCSTVRGARAVAVGRIGRVVLPRQAYALLLSAFLLAATAGCARTAGSEPQATASTRTMNHRPGVARSAATSVTLEDGGAVIVRDHNRVTILDAAGRMAADSYCGNVGGYRYATDFMQDLQQLLETGDRTGLASRVSFPLTRNTGTGERVVVTSRSELLAHFDHLFTKTVVDKITDADPREVFCRFEGFMIGDGVVWAGNEGIFTING